MHGRAQNATIHPSRENVGEKHNTVELSKARAQRPCMKNNEKHRKTLQKDLLLSA